MDRVERLVWRAMQAAQGGRDANALMLVKAALAICRDGPGADRDLVARLERVHAIAAGSGAATALEHVPRAKAPHLAAILDRLEAWAEVMWATDSRVKELRAAVEEGAAEPALLALALTAGARSRTRRGRLDEALKLGREAVALWRLEAATGEGESAPRLAEALRLLGAIETAMGSKAESVTLTAEACRMLRGLVEREPERFLPQLASALHNLAGARLQADDLSGAVAATRTAVELRRKLAADAHPSCELCLAESLTESSLVLVTAGLADEALKKSAEAISILKRLIVDDGDDYALTLVSALRTHSRAALEAGAWDAGLTATDEEIALCRELELRDGDQAALTLAEAQHNRATFLTMRGDDAAALGSVVSAIETRRSLAAPSLASQKALSASLHLAGMLAARCGQHSQSITWFEQAARVRKSLRDIPQASAEEDIAQTSVELARAYARVGRIADAARVTDDVVNSFGLLSRAHSHAGDLARHARALLQAGNLHRKAGDVDAAIGAYAGAARLGARLRRSGSDEAMARAAAQKLVICLKRAGRAEEAEMWRQRFGGDRPH